MPNSTACAITARVSDPTKRHRLDLILAGAGLALMTSLLAFAYAPGIGAPFIYDDLNSIVQSPTMRHFPDCMAGSSRPLTALSFHLNYRATGDAPAPFRLVNLGIHLGCMILLWHVLTLLGGRDRRAWCLAFAAALLWGLHPLQTESVTYIVQRAESLMSLFYLAALAAALHSLGPGARRSWQPVAVALCALGMLTKPIMVTAPLAILLAAAVHVRKSPAALLRQRPAFWSALAVTWCVPLLILLRGNESAETTGLAAHLLSPAAYGATQCGVVLHYLRLILAPAHLCIAIDWPAAASLADALPAALAIGLLLVLTAGLWRRSPVHGFLAAWFFLMLLPTSSVFPIADYAVEHRTYLASAGVIALAVAGLERALRAALPTPRARLNAGTCVVAVAVAALVMATRARNAEYRDERALWRSAVAADPANYSAAINLARVEILHGNRAAAGAVCEVITNDLAFIARLSPDEIETRGSLDGGFIFERKLGYLVKAHDHLGLIAMDADRRDEARAHFEEALRLAPNFPASRRNLAFLLIREDRLADAAQAWSQLARQVPDDVRARTWTGLLTLRDGSDVDALAHFRAALHLSPGLPVARFWIAWIRLAPRTPDAGDLREGSELALQLGEESQYRNFRVLDLVAATQAAQGRYLEAAATLEAAIAQAEGDRAEAPWLEGMRERLARYRRGEATDAASRPIPNAPYLKSML